MVDTPELASVFGRRPCGSSQVVHNHWEEFEGNVLTGPRTGMPPGFVFSPSRLRTDTYAPRGTRTGLRPVTRRSCPTRSRAAPHPVHWATGPGRSGENRNDEAEARLDELDGHALEERCIHLSRTAAGKLVAWDTLQTMIAATAISIATSKHVAHLHLRVSAHGRPAVHEAAA